MKIIFLDIDGVLNVARSLVVNRGPCYKDNPEHVARLDQTGIKLLQRVEQVTGAKFVLSSTWRLGCSYARLGELMNLSIVDETPTGEINCKRGNEIQTWLVNHPDVTHYVILDDDADMLESQMNKLIQTSRNDGISYSNIKKMVELLGNKEEDLWKDTQAWIDDTD